MKAYALCFLGLLLLLVLPSSAYAAAYTATGFFFASSPVEATVVTAAEQKPERSRLLFALSVPSFGTAILAARPELYPAKRGVAVMLLGMGGNVDRYGTAAESSMTAANGLLDEGYYPIAIENRVYVGARGNTIPVEKRLETVDFHGDLARQTAQLTDDLSLIAAHMERNPDGSLKQELVVYTRSNGTGRVLEWLHQLMTTEDPKMIAVARDVKTFVVSGLNGHVNTDWMVAEDKEEILHPLTSDPVATKVDRLLYKSMRWESRDMSPIQPAHVRQIPSVVAIIATKDNYLTPSLQTDSMSAFSRLHPQVPVRLVVTPAKHDPTQSLKAVFPDSTKAVRNGKIFRQVLRDHVIAGSPSKSGAEQVLLTGFEKEVGCSAWLSIYGGL